MRYRRITRRHNRTDPEGTVTMLDIGRRRPLVGAEQLRPGEPFTASPASPTPPPHRWEARP